MSSRLETVPLNLALVKRIVVQARETMLAWYESGLVQRTDGHIVIMDPRRSFCSDSDNRSQFQDAILFEISFGDVEKWEYPFKEIAKNKARVVWRTGLSSRRVVSEFPHLLDRGDYTFPGGIIFNGFIVAYSGVEAEWDEAFAYMVAAMLRAVVISAIAD